jgi:hypothetical protein
MKLEPVPCAALWVTVPDAIAEWPHLVDSVAEIAAQEVIARDYPELWRHGFRIQSWSGYALDLRWIESQDNFGKASNRCRVWVTGPNPERYRETVSVRPASQKESWGHEWLQPEPVPGEL